MTVIQTKYFPGKYGLGTEFAFSEMPLEYVRKFTNRFINLKGDAEKRQGLSQLGSTVAGIPTITGLHEFVDKQGTSYLFASAAGVIYRYNTTTLAWDSVLTGKDATKRLLSVQMGDKLIFVNGSDRNFYTDDGGTTFKELKAISEQGIASSTATGASSLTDADLSSWTSQTFVTNNDLLFNATVSAYAIITSVGASNLVHSPISSSAVGIGQAARNPASGDVYEIIDLVEMNVIPTGLGFDNFATITSGSSPTRISVSGVDFTNSDVRAGDFIYNTTRNAVTRITSVSANLVVTSVKAQTVNDTVTFYKSAMPIATWPHVHYGRFYAIDQRNQGQVKISGPDDPQDFTTSQTVLDAAASFYTSRQPQAETLLSIKTFQQYLVVAGQRNVYIDSGINPSATSAAAVDVTPVGLFPQGCVSRFALESIGGAMIFGANDGMRNFTAVFNSETFQTANLSEAIKSEITAAISNKADEPDDIQAIHYPRRNWLMFKVGDTIYNYNYTPTYTAGRIEAQTYGSFSTFTGKFAQQEVFYVRRNGDLICAGADGKIYEFDQGAYDDDGDTITTALETAFLSLTEPQLSTQMKSGTYIKPVFETSQPITYTIEVTGGYGEGATDTAIATTTGVGMVGFGVVGGSPVGGNRVYNDKLPLRWRGEEFKVTIRTDSTLGPDIITGFVIYGNILGKQ